MKIFVAVLLLFSAYVAAEPPPTFKAAKALMKKVYSGHTNDSFYCGCSWNWLGRKGAGRMDLSSCGYEIYSDRKRASRLEWEHVQPISLGGRQMTCWAEAKQKRYDSRKYCRSTSPAFSRMEADMHNLTPSVGEVNFRRSNFQFGVITGERRVFGACDFEFDRTNRVAEPPEHRRGMIARIYLYMSERYGVHLDSSQRALFVEWNESYPATEWEQERDRRIAAIQGWSNHYVSKAPYQAQAQGDKVQARLIHGNRRSKIYHLPTGCPNYNTMSDRNKVEFASESNALKAGYRKARNCDY